MCKQHHAGAPRRRTWGLAPVALSISLAFGMASVPVSLAQAQPVASAVAQQAHSHACPMHPDETGMEGDRCPICNMFLTEAEAAESAHDHAAHDHAGHDHSGHTHACPMHPDETGMAGDRCPICNMFLTEAEAAESAHEHSGHDHSGQDMQLDPLPTAPAFDSQVSSGEATIKYVCPMHPQIVSDVPSTCPICGMNLEKVEMGTASEEVVVGVSGGMQQALGVRTEVVERGTLWRYIKTLGTVQYNEDAISHVHTRVTGWVEQLGVTTVGQRVEQGDLLYQLYSPELVNAQDDYLQAMDYIGADPRRGKELLRKARLRLELLGMSDSVINQLERSGESLYRVPFYAPRSGIVSQLNVRDGMYIQPGETQIELVDLSTVWVIADVFENEQSWLELGRPADVTAAAQGLFEIEGQIDYIYPELDPVTRSMQVRVKLDNPGQQLRPGSLVDVELYGGPSRNLLIVPTEALILTGRENRVVVQREDTGFASVPVRLGMMSQGRAEILEGLNDGDRVVVSGQFLLDSEASIQGSLRRMSQASSEPAEGTDPHAGHNH
ncbi:efflux RND transporter periplasmic adaptor subunit [Ferrimonas marina]|uniref:Membrane fusion protein, Cu(I)/Ag(I) efflux system n=1 Tax=Ferrimonas marina TaxID=299255 RepID=A0A1M5XT31_9GAMM|nr:efflux RND transporter periplasmic adaptor subunit [Ferrimonas marina]SHI02684.1 membrane fusion protein, Cu(I)/Ag(I) efflux system [Ferrimonas marina]